MPDWQERIAHYLLSIPERAIRSLSALTGGLLKEVGDVTVPGFLRRSRLYRVMVEGVVRFMVEQVGEVQGVFPTEGKLAEDFLVRRAAGNGLELIGLLTMRASPVWVLAVLADLSGAGRHMIQEISSALKQEGLIPQDSEPGTIDQVLDALEATAGRSAEAINTPPLDVAGLRAEWKSIQAEFSRMPQPGWPKLELLEAQWRDLKETAQSQNRTVFELSAAMALSTLSRFPESTVWFSKTASAAARRTGKILNQELLGHYSRTLQEIRQQGFLRWWIGEFRPYLKGAIEQFSPRRRSLTERWLKSRNSAK